MKKIQSLLLNATAYTVLILALFYLFAAVTGYTQGGIGFPMYALILGFGLVISLASLIFKAEKLSRPVQFIAHYAVLFVAFLLIFVISGNIKGQGESVIFSSILIFTFFYAIVSAVVYLCRRAISRADKKVDEKMAKKSPAQKKKAPYKPIYTKDSGNENR